MRFVFKSVTVLIPLVLATTLPAQDQSFHEAPDSAKAQQNPYVGKPEAAQAGKRLYGRNCLSCHGKSGRGTGNVPSLVGAKLSVTDGEVFWFITKGDKKNGMPSWAFLPQSQRWQIVAYVKSLESSPAGAEATGAPAPEVPASTLKAPAPPAPFTDFRYEKPGTTRKITVNDLPQPFVTKSANNGAEPIARPANAWPLAPAGFKVEQYAAGLDNPRFLRTAPNGDIFLAEGDTGRIRVFHGMTSDGKPEEMQIFVTGLRRPYGIAFYPPGPNPEWIYVGNTNEVVRFRYHSGDLKASGPPEHIADLPTGGHWTRTVEFSPDGKRMFVAVGSESNDDDTDENPAEKNRADILACNPES
jgi:mono/diheme cytochrome c family protein